MVNVQTPTMYEGELIQKATNHGLDPQKAHSSAGEKATQEEVVNVG